MALITQIISGGQVGADIGGLRAGYNLSGVITGGWMPQGWRTIDGPRPDYQELFGMRQMSCTGYPPRTRQNVLDSDGTLRFATNFMSRGEQATMRYIQEFNRPYRDIQLRVGQNRIGMSVLYSVCTWLAENDIAILNIAGNADPALERPVEDFLFRLVSRHNERERRRIAREQLDSFNGTNDTYVTVDFTTTAVNTGNNITFDNFTIHAEPIVGEDDPGF